MRSVQDIQIQTLLSEITSLLHAGESTNERDRNGGGRHLCNQSSSYPEWLSFYHTHGSEQCHQTRKDKGTTLIITDKGRHMLILPRVCCPMLNTVFVLERRISGSTLKHSLIESHISDSVEMKLNMLSLAYAIHKKPGIGPTHDLIQFTLPSHTLLVPNAIIQFLAMLVSISLISSSPHHNSPAFGFPLSTITCSSILFSVSPYSTLLYVVIRAEFISISKTLTLR